MSKNSFLTESRSIRSQTPQVYSPKSNTQYKSFSKPVQEIQAQFDLQKFRSSISDKISPLVKPNDFDRRRLNESQLSEGRSSTQGIRRNRDGLTFFMGSDVDRRQPFNLQQKHDSIPTFDTLERNIQGLSSSRLAQDFQSSKEKGPYLRSFQQLQPQQQQMKYSPKKLSGIKSKIGMLGGINQSNILVQQPKKQEYNQYTFSQIKQNTPSQNTPSQNTPQSRGDFNQIIQKSYSGFLTSKEQESRIQFPTSTSFYNKQKNFADMLPINNLIDMRNKIEAANTSSSSSQQLPSNYLNELVKLASVITSSIKNLR